MSTKPTKAGKTIRNNTNHQVFSILCVPGAVSCQLPNPVTNLSCWVSSICMLKSSLYSSPSCSLLRNNRTMICMDCSKGLPCPGALSRERREETRTGYLFSWRLSAVYGRLAVSLCPEPQLPLGSPPHPAPLPESRNCSLPSAPSGNLMERAPPCC